MSKQWATIVVLLCSTILVAYAVFQFGLVPFPQLKARTRPQQFSGDWSAVGIQGDSRGIITFTPNGRIDSHDDYLGKWWLESGTIHVQFRSAAPQSLIEYVLPKWDEYVFTIARNQENLPSVMQGANVVLRRAGSSSQQRTSPNKAVNPSGGSGGL